MLWNNAARTATMLDAMQEEAFLTFSDIQSTAACLTQDIHRDTAGLNFLNRWMSVSV